MMPRAGRQAAGEGDQVDPRVARSAARRRSAPAPRTRLPTPAGRPASSSSRISRIAVCGVSSLGLSTKVLPAAQRRARPSRRPAAAGSSTGVISAQTPTGSCTMRLTTSALPVSTTRPASVAGDPAEVAEDARRRRRCRTRLSTSRLPVSSDSASGRRSPGRARAGRRRRQQQVAALAARWCAATGRRRRRRGPRRSRPRCPRRPASSTSATSVPSAGQRISRRPPARAPTHVPSM